MTCVPREDPLRTLGAVRIVLYGLHRNVLGTGIDNPVFANAELQVFFRLVLVGAPPRRAPGETTSHARAGS